MPYSLELSFNDRMTVGQVARYMELLRAAGASDDTVLEEVHPLGDDSILAGWTYQADELPKAPGRGHFRLPASVVRDALDMLRDVAASDGDVRDLMVATVGVHDALNRAVMSELGFPEVPVNEE
jgi:hypothetical protein